MRGDLYCKAAAEMLKASTSIAWSWDGAGYQGLPVNIAMALGTETFRGCHVKAQVGSHGYFPISLDFSWKGRSGQMQKKPLFLQGAWGGEWMTFLLGRGGASQF